MSSYRNPGPTQLTNERPNRLMRQVLDASGTISMTIVINAGLDRRALDLSAKSARLLIESLALVDAANRGEAVENLEPCLPSRSRTATAWLPVWFPGSRSARGR